MTNMLRYDVFSTKLTKAMKFTDEDLQDVYDSLIRNESMAKTFIGGLMGASIAIAFYWLFIQMEYILVVFLIIPPAVIGYFAGIIGQPYQMKTRIPIGLLAVVVHILSIEYFNMNLIFLIFIPIAFAEAYIVAKIKLSKIETVALDMAEIGKINNRQN